MKKVFAILLAAVMLFSFAACSASAGKDNKDDADTSNQISNAEVKDLGIDMSKYPSDINEWTGKNFADYFTEAGVFKDGDGYETWIQDHSVQWGGTPVDECVGCWDDAETFSIMILTLNTKNADSTDEMLNEWLTSIKEKKACPGDFSVLTVDHLVGNVAFEFEATILDDDVYNAMTDAYNYLVKSLNVTPEF